MKCPPSVRHCITPSNRWGAFQELIAVSFFFYTIWSRAVIPTRQTSPRARAEAQISAQGA